MNTFFLKIEDLWVENTNITEIENKQEFTDWLQEKIIETKAMRKILEKPKYKTEVFVANLRIFGYVIEELFPYKLKMKTNINKLFENENGDRLTGVYKLSTNYLTIRDMGSIIGHFAPFLEDYDYEESKKMVEYLASKYDKVPETLPSLLINEIRETKTFKPIGFYMHKKIENGQFVGMNYNDIEYFRKYCHGGLNFHNENYKNQILENVHYFDINSAYPTVMINQKFPMSMPFKTTWENLMRIVGNRAIMWLAHIKFRPKEYITKGINPLKLDLNVDYELYITNFDFEIIKQAYHGNLSVAECYYFDKYDYLPEEYRQILKSHFNDKQEMKVKKNTPEFDEGQYNFLKKILNINYGVMATKDKNVDKREGFFNYDYENIFWEIFVTAHQRAKLWWYIQSLGSAFLYCNTDSVYSLKKCKLISIGNKLGQVEYKLLDRFIYKGCNKYLVKYKGKYDFCCASAQKVGIKKWAENTENIMELFANDDVTIPAEYNVKFIYAIIPSKKVVINRTKMRLN